MREENNDDNAENMDKNCSNNNISQNYLTPYKRKRSASLTCNTLKFELEIPNKLNNRRPSQLLIGDNELTVKFCVDDEDKENIKISDEIISTHSCNDSNNNLYNLNQLQIPSSSIDTLNQSNVSLNVPSIQNTLTNSINQTNVSSSNTQSTNNNVQSNSAIQHHQILLRAPDLNVVQEGEIMQFAISKNHSSSYSINNQIPNSQTNSFRLSPSNNQTAHHRTSRCNLAYINNQSEFCNCNNYRHSMFVGSDNIDYSIKKSNNHLYPEEVYDDFLTNNNQNIKNRMHTSTSMDCVNNQWVSSKQHLCPSCNCNHSNYKKSSASLSEKNQYHVHQLSCYNLNQINKYNSQENYLYQSNLKNKDFYSDPNQKTINQPKERLTQILGEMIIPFIFAGLGNVATGYMLSNVQHWSVFKNVPQLIILIPALLGLKGNVEMTLASRLSTHANLGHMDKGSNRRKMVIGNMALVQCQSSTVGFLAPLIALAISYINPDENDILTKNEIILLMTASVVTANIANLILSTFMFAVIFVCRKIKINPDNVATPIAASLGDFLTMTLLAYISKILFKCIDKPILQISILSFLLMLIPLYAFMAKKIKFTKKIVFTGFTPICGAMMLQITGGMIMETALSQFKKLAAFQPVINGVGGNLVSIQCSRMATYLHKNSRKRYLPETDPYWLRSPVDIFFSSKSEHSGMARMLLCLSIPSHLLFLIVIKITRDIFIITSSFLIVYVIAASFQVACLLYLAYTLTHFLWKKGINPDNSTIPFLTAFADLIGSALLALSFAILNELKDENAFQATLTNINIIINNNTIS